MDYLKMGFGVIVCAIGGWQLAGALGSGDGSGNGSGAGASSGSVASTVAGWGPRCTEMAQRLFADGSSSPVKINGNLLRLQEQGCNPRRAPAGAIPSTFTSDKMDAEAGEWDDSPKDWGGEGGEGGMAEEGWGE